MRGRRAAGRGAAVGGALSAAGLGIALVLAGGVFDAEPLFVGGAAFAALGTFALLWVGIASRGVRLEREVSATRVVEDEPLLVRIAVTAPLPLPGGAVIEPLLAASVPVRPGRRRVRIRIEVRFERRGLRALPPPALVLRDPLALASVSAAGTGAGDEVLVLPRIEPLQVTADPDPAGADRSLAALVGVAEVEMDGLRGYRPGTSASRIHWPPLARGAGLLERRLRPDGDGRPLVVLDPRAPAEPGHLDAAVRAAASLAHELAQAGGAAVLLPGERRATRLERDLRAWPAVWARLALVEAGPPPPLAGLGSRTGPVLYVAARPPARLPRALTHAPGARILIVPVALPGRVPRLHVAGCHGYALGRVGARPARGAAA